MSYLVLCILLMIIPKAQSFPVQYRLYSIIYRFKRMFITGIYLNLLLLCQSLGVVISRLNANIATSSWN